MCMTEFVPAANATTGVSDPFLEKLLGILNAGGLGLMLSIGHRTGLFDTLGTLRPATIGEIAAAAELNERYVREWLGAMVTGGIVEHDPDAGTYWLPAERAAFLTRAASPNNIAAATQFFAVLGGVEDRIVRCFKEGGGVPYAAFQRFHEVMAEESSQTVVAALQEHILPLVPGAVTALQEGIDVLDVGCGAGRALNFLARQFPESRFVGYDISEEAIARAQAEAHAAGITNARFVVRDVAQLNGHEHYDLVTAFDAIHDQAHPDRVLAGIRRALRPGGTFLMQDIAGSSCVHQDRSNPLAPFSYTISCMHCMTVSLAQGGMGLGAMWGRRKAESMLAAAGFTQVDVQQLPHDILNYYYIVRA